MNNYHLPNLEKYLQKIHILLCLAIISLSLLLVAPECHQPTKVQENCSSDEKLIFLLFFLSLNDYK
jgi:hypothetical protein